MIPGHPPAVHLYHEPRERNIHRLIIGILHYLVYYYVVCSGRARRSTNTRAPPRDSFLSRRANSGDWPLFRLCLCSSSSSSSSRRDADGPETCTVSPLESHPPRAQCAGHLTSAALTGAAV